MPAHAGWRWNMRRRSRVDAVVVSYNVRDLLLACVASLIAAREAGELAEIVVVDNGSSDGSAGAVRSRFPGIRVIDAPNRGYGAGANRGIEVTVSPYVLVLNPDTVVPLGAVRTMTDYLDAHPWTAVVGPRLRHPDGTIQSSRRRFPTRLTPIFESTALEEWWPDNPWVRRYRMTGGEEDISQECDWIVGAAMLARREAIEHVGCFDESFWMYSEEVEWCWRFRSHGWRVAYVPNAEIMHYEGASSAQDIPRRQVEFDTSRVRLMRVMYGPRWAGVVRRVLLVGYLVAWFREFGKWLLGHRKDLRRERMRIYWAGLRGRLQPAPGMDETETDVDRAADSLCHG